MYRFFPSRRRRGVRMQTGPAPSICYVYIYYKLTAAFCALRLLSACLRRKTVQDLFVTTIYLEIGPFLFALPHASRMCSGQTQSIRSLVCYVYISHNQTFPEAVFTRFLSCACGARLFGHELLQLYITLAKHKSCQFSAVPRAGRHFRQDAKITGKFLAGPAQAFSCQHRLAYGILNQIKRGRRPCWFWISSTSATETPSWFRR